MMRIGMMMMRTMAMLMTTTRKQNGFRKKLKTSKFCFFKFVKMFSRCDAMRPIIHWSIVKLVESQFYIFVQQSFCSRTTKTCTFTGSLASPRRHFFRPYARRGRSRGPASIPRTRLASKASTEQSSSTVTTSRTTSTAETSNVR